MESQLKSLQERLQQAEERAELHRQQRDQAEERAEQEKQSAEQAQEQIRSTTLEEMLKHCHNISQNMTVETNKLFSTQGSTTSPKNKPCPSTLRPWLEFPDLRQQAFNTAYNILHPPDSASLRSFSPLTYIQELGRKIQGRKIASEVDLRIYHSNFVEDFVTQIISILAENPQDGQKFSLGQGVTFENHTNTLSDFAEEVQAHLPLSTSSTHPHHTPKPIYADQICIYKKEGGETELLFIREYKAPHKLTKEALRVGLRAMDLPAEVINRSMIPNDPCQKFEYNSDRLVAAALTQTYSYMLESGIEYGCVITGEAMVFLQIKEDDPTILHYHLAEPNGEVDADASFGFQHPLTAIGQLLSFCIISFRSKRRSQHWRDASIRNAQKWTDDWAKILHDVPREEGKSEPPPSAYKARKYPINHRLSPYHTRKRKLVSYRSSSSPEIETKRHDSEDSADEFSEGPSIDTPSKGRGATVRRGKRQRSVQGRSTTGNQQQRYCTQGCLLGLVQGSALDMDCPNARLHRCGEKGRTHLLDKQHFSTLIQRQLAVDLDYNCEELKKQGIRGAMFKITLVSHGYTFVGKATRDVFVPYLQHEGRIYDRLQSLQGKSIPVYLGNIDLDRPWRDLHVRLIHMLLMSWGGERAYKFKGVGDLEAPVKQFEDEIERLGVQHNDLIPANILWNDQIQKVMFIDFEAATIVRKGVLQELSTNRKRKWEIKEQTIREEGHRIHGNNFHALEHGTPSYRAVV